MQSGSENEIHYVYRQLHLYHNESIQQQDFLFRHKVCHLFQQHDNLHDERWMYVWHKNQPQHQSRIVASGLLRQNLDKQDLDYSRSLESLF